MNRLIADQKNGLTHLLEAGKPDPEMINELFWTALTRAPEASEGSRFTELLGEAKEATEKRAALEDLLWALLNSKEFVFRK